MNLQQAALPRSSANGFGHKRGEKEMGSRVDNKSQAGKSNINKMTTAGLPTGNKGRVDSPSRERLVYLTACLIGHQVEVQVIDGSVFSGIFHATNAENNFGIILKMACVTKAGFSQGQNNISDSVNKTPSKTLIIPAKDLVQIVAKSVPVTRDGLTNELQHERQQDIMIDSSISHSRHVELERELEPWVPDDNLECPELDNTFDQHWNRGWDQFKTNATLFGVKSTFNEELYTTKLDRGPRMRELEKVALRIAREIEGEDTQDLHLAEERGNHSRNSSDVDEETKYSSVFRGVDDSGYDENEDTWDSENNETFGDVSDSVMNKSLTDLTSGKSKDGPQVPSSFPSSVEVRSSQLSTSTDFYPFGSLDCESRRIQDNESSQQNAGSHYTKEDTEKHMFFQQNQASKSEDTESALGPKKENFDKGLSAEATAYAPSNVSSKAQEKMSSSEVSEGAPSVKMHEATQPAISCTGPGSSASSTSECGNAASAASGPGLSPSSSMGTLNSEKSTLNPHAKEFRLNPNAKSFVPLQTPLRPASSVSDGSFYYPANVAPVPHMQGVTVGVGMGTSYAPHQPVIYSPQATSFQSQQAYFHSNGPQYGQQMLLGQPRQIMYMPTYPPEMHYKGRDF